jgi:hypothetical protein
VLPFCALAQACPVKPVDLPTAQKASPDALRERLKASIGRWVPAVRAAGVKPE